MHERVTVVTCLSLCHSVTLSVCHFSILEKAPFSGLKLTSKRLTLEVPEHYLPGGSRGPQLSVTSVLSCKKLLANYTLI